MERGKRIYFEKTNGVIIAEVCEGKGDIVETTLEDDVRNMPILTLINPSQLGIKQLQYGDLSDKFNTSRGYRINPQTEEIEFVTTE